MTGVLHSDGHRKENKLLRNIRKNKLLYLIMVPGLIYFLVFRYAPLYELIVAFQDFTFKDGIAGSPWVGLKHFEYMFSTDKFFEVLRNTVLIQLYKMLFGFPGPIILALLLNEVTNLRYKKCLQTSLYLPHFLSWSIVGGMFISILAPTGILNTVLEDLGLKTYNWMMDPGKFRGIIVVTDIWKGVGWGSIIYLAAISAIDPQLYEAATVDGARKHHMMFHITIPSIMPTIVIMFILSLGSFLSVGFDQIYIMYNPSVYEVGDVISTYIYRTGLQSMRFSYTTAVGIFESLVGFILILGANMVARRINGGEYAIW